MIRSIIAALLTLTLSLPTHADWPNYLGANFDNTADDTKIVDSIDDSLTSQWTIKVGPGYGSASIQGNEVFILDRIQGEKDVLRVLNLENGEELWKVEYDAPGRLQFPGSRSIPTIKGDYVYTSGGFGHVTCINRKTKKIDWQKNLIKDYGGKVPTFGYSTHPVLYQDTVIVASLGSEVGLVALNKKDGSEAWRTGGLFSSFSSPVIRKLNGIDQCIFLSSSEAGSLNKVGDFYVSSFDPANGKMLWRFEGFNANNPIPVAISIDNNKLLLTAGYDAGTALLKVKKIGENFKLEKLKSVNKGAQIHTPILFEDHIYLIVNENRNLQPRSKQKEGGLMCMTKDGAVKWRTGANPNFGRGGMVLADGKLVIQDGNTGNVHLVKPDPSGYKELGRANIFDKQGRKDHKMWAPPTISQGRMLLRSQDELKCLDLRKK